MPNLNIVIGYRTEHRSGEPVVLASGFDRAKLQVAVDAAPKEFARFDLGVFDFQRQARRRAGAQPSEQQPDLNKPFDGPSDADWFAALDEIERLRRALSDEREQVLNEQGALANALAEIERLKALPPAEAAPNSLQNNADIPPAGAGGVSADAAPAADPVGDSAGGGNPPPAAVDAGPQLAPAPAEAGGDKPAGKKSRN